MRHRRRARSRNSCYLRLARTGRLEPEWQRGHSRGGWSEGSCHLSWRKGGGCHWRWDGSRLSCCLGQAVRFKGSCLCIGSWIEPDWQQGSVCLSLIVRSSCASDSRPRWPPARHQSRRGAISFSVAIVAHIRLVVDAVAKVGRPSRGGKRSQSTDSASHPGGRQVAISIRPGRKVLDARGEAVRPIANTMGSQMDSLLGGVDGLSVEVDDTQDDISDGQPATPADTPALAHERSRTRIQKSIKIKNRPMNALNQSDKRSDVIGTCVICKDYVHAQTGVGFPFCQGRADQSQGRCAIHATCIHPKTKPAREREAPKWMDRLT